MGKKLSLEKIEKNKDKLDLKPNVQFVAENYGQFLNGLVEILSVPLTPESMLWSQSIKFVAVEEIVMPQLMPHNIKDILARMPKAIRELSKLEEVNYLLHGAAKVIPVPGYDDDGNFDPSKVEKVPINKFPRPGDHPSRILVGVSNGPTIFPTPIPASVSTNERAIYLYQVHVFLHELFHTIDYPRRDPGLKANIILETNNQQFTLEEWWHDFEELILSGREPKCVSSYAATYVDRLNYTRYSRNYEQFTRDFAEQVCESFVAYMLGIISNDNGWTSFKEESFGNNGQLKLFLNGKSPAANEKWLLINRLCNATVLQND